jgi:hypothetical protein
VLLQIVKIPPVAAAFSWAKNCYCDCREDNHTEASMSELHKRIRKTSLHSRIMTPEETIPFFRNGMDSGWSGFTPANWD